MRVERIVDAAVVHGAADLFDAPPLPAATERFLAEAGPICCSLTTGLAGLSG